MNVRIVEDEKYYIVQHETPLGGWSSEEYFRKSTEFFAEKMLGKWLGFKKPLDKSKQFAAYLSKFKDYSEYYLATTSPKQETGIEFQDGIKK